MTLISVGVDHERSSLDLLERLTVPEHEWPKVLRLLVSHRNIHEAVFVSTCLRTEVVAVVDLFHGAVDEITAVLAEVTDLPASEITPHLSVHFDRGVADHLFSVAAGLKSVVPGEFEVLGQLRRALDLALEEQTAGEEMDELFHRALASGRRVRNETAIARGTTSFAHAAASFAIEELGPEFTNAEVLIVGAGRLAGGVAKSLLAATPGLATLTFINRTKTRAETMCATLGDPRARVVDSEQLAEQLARVRLVITAVEVTTPLINVAQLSMRTEPLFLVDLGVPRAVARDVSDLATIRRVDIDDLRVRVERALGNRREALGEAEELVRHDVARYLEDRRARGASNIVRQLRERFDELVEVEMTRRAHELAAMSDEQRDQVTSLVRAVVAKIAHRPTMALKEAAGSDQGLRLTEATRNLFDL